MTEAERVLAELAKRLHNPKPESVLTWDEVKALTAPYLPKPEPDRLMDAAKTCAEIGKYMCAKDAAHQIRTIIAREVAAAEPSDEALRKFENAASLFSQLRTTVAVRFDGLCERELWLSINAAFDKLEAARAALKGKAYE